VGGGNASWHGRRDAPHLGGILDRAASTPDLRPHQAQEDAARIGVKSSALDLRLSVPGLASGFYARHSSCGGGGDWARAWPLFWAGLAGAGLQF